MLVTIAASVLLSLIAVGIHYESLHLASTAVAQPQIPRRMRVALAVLLALVAHVVEALIFAVGWAVMLSTGHAELAGATAGTDDALYFSFITYTSLGYGDIVPLGPSRLLAGIEALVGLVLIAWTASFTYYEMRRYWPKVD